MLPLIGLTFGNLLMQKQKTSRVPKTSKVPNVAPKNAKPNPPNTNLVKPTPTKVIHVFSPIVLLMFCFSFFFYYLVKCNAW
jgi:hypothetical protein